MGTIVKKAARLTTFHHRKILGDKASRSTDFAGQLVGAYDNDKAYAPETPDTPAVTDPGSAFTARDRIRRTAKRAQGRDSTIRTSPTGAPYTGAPSKLLGG